MVHAKILPLHQVLKATWRSACAMVAGRATTVLQNLVIVHQDVWMGEAFVNTEVANVHLNMLGLHATSSHVVPNKNVLIMVRVISLLRYFNLSVPALRVGLAELVIPHPFLVQILRAAVMDNVIMCKVSVSATKDLLGMTAQNHRVQTIVV
jgi:hypothetical protein